MKLRYKLKRRQVKMIKRFAQMMKWPNLRETLEALRQGAKDSTLDKISSHSMAFFSGLVLPGVSLPQPRSWGILHCTDLGSRPFLLSS